MEWDKLTPGEQANAIAGFITKWTTAITCGKVETLQAVIQECKSEGLTLTPGDARKYLKSNLPDEKNFRMVLFAMPNGEGYLATHPHDWLPERYSKKQKELFKDNYY